MSKTYDGISNLGEDAVDFISYHFDPNLTDNGYFFLDTYERTMDAIMPVLTTMSTAAGGLPSVAVMYGTDLAANALKNVLFSETPVQDTFKKGFQETVSHFLPVGYSLVFDPISGKMFDKTADIVNDKKKTKQHNRTITNKCIS